MKTLIKKTKAEMEGETEYSSIQVKDIDSYNECWSCDKCHLLFEPDDFVIMGTKNGKKQYFCPNSRKQSFLGGVNQCREQIRGGDRAYYERHYHLKEKDES